MAAGPLEGKIALVTGAGSPIGLGRSMTLALAAAGARVALVDRNAQWLERTLAEVRSLSGEHSALAILADITDPAAAERAVERTLSGFGALHILVNNAGTSPWAEGMAPEGNSRNARFWEISPQAWSRVVSVNVNGAFLMSRAAVQPMLAQRWGRIISVTTSFDSMYRKGMAPYGPSKAAHEAFVALMAQELEATGVTANVLTPGGMSNTNLIPAELSEELRRRLISPDVMRSPVVWLASAESDGFNGRRIIAARWNERAPLKERLAAASAPAAWPQLGRQAILPED